MAEVGVFERLLVSKLFCLQSPEDIPNMVPELCILLLPLSPVAMSIKIWMQPHVHTCMQAAVTR